MGLSSKKQKTTSQSTFNNTSTSTPNVPDWIRNPYERAAGQVGALQGMDPMSFAPQASDLSQLAYGRAAARTTSPQYDEAAGMARGIDYSPGSVDTDYAFDSGNVKGESLLDGIEKYYNPFRDQVLNPVLSDYDETAGKVRAAQAANGAKNQAFRGTRFAIREGETEGQLARGRAATEGGLLSDMFTQATSLASQDAARRQAAAEGNAARRLSADTTSAGMRMQGQTTNAGLRDTAVGRQLQGAGLLSDIANQRGVSDRADIALQGQLGSEKTGIENARRTAPLDVQKQLQGLLAGLNPALFTGETSTSSGTSSGTSTTKQSQSLLAFLGDLMLAGASSGGQAARAAAGGG